MLGSGQQHVGGHCMQGICLESNDRELVKRCLEALCDMEWYRSVAALEIRSSTNIVKLVGKSYSTVIG